MMVTQAVDVIDASGHGAPSSPAPGQLEKIRPFVNTLDLEAGSDALTTPAALTAWLAAHDLLSNGAGGTASAAEVAQAVALREAFRAVLITHVQPAQDEPGVPPVPALRELAAGLPIQLAISDDGQVRAEPAAEGATGSLTRLLLIAADAAPTGTWARLKE